MLLNLTDPVTQWVCSLLALGQEPIYFLIYSIQTVQGVFLQVLLLLSQVVLGLSQVILGLLHVC